MKEYKTLADTFKEYDDLPPWLATHGKEEYMNAKTDEEIDKYFESVFNTNAEHIRESRKGALDTVRSYCMAVDKENWSWEDFSEKCKDQIEEFGLKKEDYTRTINGINNESIKLYDPKTRNADNSSRLKVVDDRPDFDPDNNDEDPIMASIFKILKEEAVTEAVEESVNRKYHQLYECARNVVNARSASSHAIIGGAPGVGKTWTIGPAVDQGLKEWRPNRRHQNKPKRVDVAGSIGKSMTDVLETFYKNRHEKILVLDDADGFLNGSDEDIANMMKVFLGPVKEATIPGGIRTKIQQRADSNAERAEANRLKAKEKAAAEQSSLPEGLTIHVDTSRLAEGKLTVSSEYARCTVPVSLQEAAKLGAKFGYKPFRETKYYDPLHKVDAYIDHIGLYRESDELSDVEKKLIDEIDKVAKDNNISDEEIVAEEIPEKFFFDSNLIVITNLHFADLDESMQAVISRCSTMELYLTKEEYLCRAEQIIPDMEIGLDSVNTPAILEWAKRESFTFFKALMIGSSKFKNYTVQINQRLDFRLLTKIASLLILRMYEFSDNNGLELDTVVNTPELRSKMESAIKVDYIKDLLDFLKQRT